MKKLMVAVALAVAATFANAATVKWSSTGSATSKTIYAADGKTTLYAASGVLTAYLFASYTIDSVVYGTTQDGLLSSLRDGTAFPTKSALAEQGITSSSKLTDMTGIEAGDAGMEKSFFWAIFDEDNENVFLSTTKTVTLQSATESPLAWSGISTATKNAFDNKTTFASDGTGWYSTEAVPEPISGTLCLLGMGAIALRRKMKKAKKA